MTDKMVVRTPTALEVQRDREIQWLDAERKGWFSAVMPSGTFKVGQQVPLKMEEFKVKGVVPAACLLEVLRVERHSDGPAISTGLVYGDGGYDLVTFKIIRTNYIDTQNLRLPQQGLPEPPQGI
jgi:hypothetical protein